MIDFKHGPHNVRIFSVSENGENGLGDEGVDGAMPPPPRIFGLEPPLFLCVRLNQFSREIFLHI